MVYALRRDLISFQKKGAALELGRKYWRAIWESNFPGVVKIGYEASGSIETLMKWRYSGLDSTPYLVSATTNKGLAFSGNSVDALCVFEGDSC